MHSNNNYKSNSVNCNNVDNNALVEKRLADKLADKAVGLSFKPRYFYDIMGESGESPQQHNIDWFEVHAENYFAGGGPSAFMLHKLREHYPISIHGVSLNLGGSEDLDRDHLLKLKTLCDDIEPVIVSEHLAWCSSSGAYFNDLLPLPYNQDAFERVCVHIEQTQDFLQRKILIENPSLYLAYDRDKTDIKFQEAEFLNKVCATTGCSLLLDINNIYVAGTNTGTGTYEYIDNINLENVEQIHLAGHVSRNFNGKEVLIDTHSMKVIEEVWQMFEYFIDRCNEKDIKIPPSMIEWDNDLPEFQVLLEELSRMQIIMTKENISSLAYA